MANKTTREAFLEEQVHYLRKALREIQYLPSCREDESSMIAYLALKTSESSNGKE